MILWVFKDCIVSYAAVIAVGFFSGGTQGAWSLPCYTVTSSCTDSEVWVEYYPNTTGDFEVINEEDLNAYADEWTQFYRFCRVVGSMVKFRRVESQRTGEFRRWMFRSRATLY